MSTESLLLPEGESDSAKRVLEISENDGLE
jgi:hypothetical protein